jgi:sugar phosphate permease
VAKQRVSLILGSAVFAYFSSVVERSSMGVASLAATHRFGIGATALSSLSVAQLVIYAVMQIPVGILLDRFGAKKLIVFGSLVTGLGNMLVALTPVFAGAIAGRMLVGFGDAFVFVSMIRLINGWVRGGRATRFTQLFANIGQLGQIASAIPFAYFLGFAGWTPAFTLASSLALVAGCLGVVFLKNEPDFRPLSAEVGWFAQLKTNLRDVYTRKAFWVHFTMQSSGSVFILLWGYPFMVQGEGLSKATASALLSSFVFIGFVVGPILSHFCVAYPRMRHLLILGVYSLIAVAWLIILLTPGVNPFWQIIFLVLCIGIGGPASMVAFDYSRTNIPVARLGSSNGIINSGGFVATFMSVGLIGVALDAIHTSGTFGHFGLYSLAAFKLAFPLLIAVNTIGLVMFYLARRSALRLAVAKQE